MYFLSTDVGCQCRLVTEIYQFMLIEMSDSVYSLIKEHKNYVIVITFINVNVIRLQTFWVFFTANNGCV